MVESRCVDGLGTPEVRDLEAVAAVLDDPDGCEIGVFDLLLSTTYAAV